MRIRNCGRSFPARLERYVIADDVQIEDVTAEFSIFHALSASVPGPEDGRVVQANRLGEAGHDLGSRTRNATAFKELAASFSFCDDACAEVFRIERGIPRWGRSWPGRSSRWKRT